MAIWSMKAVHDGRIPTASIVSSNLVLYLDAGNPSSYPGTGTTWTDLSGSGLNMTVSAAKMTANGLASGTSASTATTSILNTDVHSIFFMIIMETNGSYPNHFSGNWDKIFSYNAGGSDRSPGVWRYPSNRLIHWRYDPNNSDADFSATASTTYVTSGTEFATNTWFYIGVTKNGATARTYVNGSPLANRSVSNPKTAGTAAITLWESYPPPARLNCLTVYNKTLTDSEVSQNFNVLRGRFGL